MKVLTLAQKVIWRLIQDDMRVSRCNTVRLLERMVDFNVSNGLPGAQEFCILAARCLVRATEGFWLLVAPVDEVLKQCKTSYATYVLDGDWKKMGLRESY